MKNLSRFLPPAILIASLAWVYGATLAPGLTWANSGADGGDLITATATGGVPHPTGYPLYLLLAGFFQHLPVGPLALRTNLMSAVAMVGAAVLVYGVVTRFLADADAWSSRLAGLVSALAFGLAPMIWSQAVITEVYGLHLFFIALLIYLSSGVLQLPPRRLDGLTGLVFGLALGNHITTIFLLPVVFASAVIRLTPTEAISSMGKHFLSRWRLDGHVLIRRAAWMVAGLSVYLTLPLRAHSGSPVNWGNPVTLSNLLWLVSGRLYQDELLTMSFAVVAERTRSALVLLLGQYGVPGLFLGLLGLVVFFSKSRLYWNMIWMTFIFSAFAVVYGTWDSYVYLLPVFLCFAIWIGVASGRLMELAEARLRLGRWLVGLAFMISLVWLAAATWSYVDASQDQRAEDFGRSVLAQAPENAILFTKGDGAVFALWYFHYALHQRPDLVVVASDLLQHDWYQHMLLSAYPSLNVPGPFPFEETIRLANPSHPACYVEYSDRTKIECLPPEQSLK